MSRPTRTVVIIDILLRTRAAMHTTIAAAADWQFEASLSEANCKRVREVIFTCLTDNRHGNAIKCHSNEFNH